MPATERYRRRGHTSPGPAGSNRCPIGHLLDVGPIIISVFPSQTGRARGWTLFVEPRPEQTAATAAEHAMPGPVVFESIALDQLLDAIKRRGFRLVGPMIRDGAICYDDLSSAEDLPEGWTDEQDAAHYRLKKR